MRLLTETMASWFETHGDAALLTVRIDDTTRRKTVR